MSSHRSVLTDVEEPAVGLVDSPGLLVFDIGRPIAGPNDVMPSFRMGFP
jgi:hypothetical protein